jgi:DGQHR domain-containing protein
MPHSSLNGSISVSCIECKQPIGAFFIGAIEASDLAAISFADIRRPDGRDIERYIGTQRDLSEGRVAEIKQYVTTVDASFPTSVILAISSEDAELDEDREVLTIRRESSVAKIIDGQHRIAGLKGYTGPAFFVNVTIFIDMELEDQAMVFATINLKQTKVTKSLAYDLYEFAKNRSPQKTSHNIAKLLNSEPKSPFEGRIKILGKATGRGMELITQATFVDRLLKLITRDAMGDKDAIKRGKSIARATLQQEKILVFRNWFIDERDAEIARCVWNYFDAVRDTWKSAWNTDQRGMILARTTGFAALMRLLPYVLTAPLGRDGKVPSKETFKSYFERVPLKATDFTSMRFIPGSSGESELVKALQIDQS